MRPRAHTRALLPVLAGLLPAAALLACPLRAHAQGTTPPAAPPTTLSDYEGHYFGVQIDLGAGVPIGGVTTTTHGVPSFLVNGEFDIDLGAYVQLAARATALLPGSRLAGGQASNAVGSVMAQVRVFPIAVQALGILRPYVGFGVGYTLITTKSQCADIGFGCSDKTLFNGVEIAPVLGIRLDIPRPGEVRGEPRRAARLISIYVEAGYDKSFWFTNPKPEVDRIVFMAGPAVTL